MGTNERMRRQHAGHLGRGERVLASVRGTVEAGHAAPWSGLLLATDRRLVLIAEGQATYLPYTAIESVERIRSLIGSSVALTTGGGNAVLIKWIDARRVRPFVRAVRGAVRAARPPRRRRRSPARSVTPS
jgi:Bacterial PH domain